ncbi:acyl-homoserine-lactone synthase [Marimonas arenosa]|uniref:N-acyl-L-homoserine lactone synthetase n=1 Tax=Marimonas arenosa TaxID=1795305 RepID=A0AAE3W9P4_9RHOB|nr:acyl-homoserine-lactone synthase [Marimonas arenosa]MDQ2088794.1 N-acyl-L-homoserine lactone synthetase [Marimonas arenosa]
MKHQRVPPSESRASLVFPELLPSRLPETTGGTTGGEQIRVKRRTRPDFATVAEKNRSVKTTTMSFASMHRYGELYVNFMKTRKRVFIDQLGWNLPCADGMEFDQYDTPFCRMVVVHEYGEVLAGIRLSPTTAQVGLHSYMLRDAQLGLLNGLPRDVLFFDAPVDPTVWEATRVFITDAVGAARRPAIQKILVNKMIDTVKESGGSSIIGIVPKIYARWLRRLDLNAVPVGPRFRIDGTLNQAILFNTRYSIQ